MRQLVGAPGQEEDVLGRTQSEEASVDIIRAEYDQPSGRAFDAGAQVGLDFVRGQLFQTRQRHGVARRQR